MWSRGLGFGLALGEVFHARGVPVFLGACAVAKSGTPLAGEARCTRHIIHMFPTNSYLGLSEWRLYRPAPLSAPRVRPPVGLPLGWWQVSSDDFGAPLIVRMEALPEHMGRPSELQATLLSVYEGRGVPWSPERAVEVQLCTTRRGLASTVAWATSRTTGSRRR